MARSLRGPLPLLPLALLVTIDALAVHWPQKEKPTTLLTTAEEEASESAMNAVKTQLSAMMAHVDAEEARNRQAFEHFADGKRRELREKLEAVRLAEIENEDIATRVHSLRESNGALRRQAESLRANLSRIVDDIRRLEVNVSVAEEFAAQALAAAGPLTREAPEVRVLQELREEDRAAEARELRQRELSELRSAAAVAGTDNGAVGDSSKAAMLQVGTPRAATSHRGHGGRGRGRAEPADVGAVAARMLAALDNISHARSLSNASLLEDFRLKSKEYDEKREEVLEEQFRLNASLEHQLQEQAELQRAVVYLQKLQEPLERQRDVVRRAMVTMGRVPLPVQPLPAAAGAAARRPSGGSERKPAGGAADADAAGAPSPQSVAAQQRRWLR